MAELGYEMVRYADDFVILCCCQEQAESALEEVKRFVTEADLTLHPENIFDKYDGMVRKRLRRQLLKRHRRNPQRLCRTHRWPNAYFTERGYRSLRTAHSGYVQSLTGNH